jgi:hypothetical protein
MCGAVLVTESPDPEGIQNPLLQHGGSNRIVFNLFHLMNATTNMAQQVGKDVAQQISKNVKNAKINECTLISPAAESRSREEESPILMHLQHLGA